MNVDVVVVIVAVRREGEIYKESCLAELLFICAVYTSRGYKYKVNGSGQRIRGTHEIGKQRETETERERERILFFVFD